VGGTWMRVGSACMVSTQGPTHHHYHLTRARHTSIDVCVHLVRLYRWWGGRKPTGIQYTLGFVAHHDQTGRVYTHTRHRYGVRRYGCIGFSTGTGIPAVFRKRVVQVWVQCVKLRPVALPYP
jgi:hypothetical protein